MSGIRNDDPVNAGPADVPGGCAHSSSWSVEASPAGMDHLLAQHGEERVWVKSLDFRSTQLAHYNPSVFKPLLE